MRSQHAPRRLGPEPALAPVRALALDTDDVGEVEHFVSGIYSRMRIGSAGATTRTTIRRDVLGPQVAFDQLAYSFDIDYRAEPPEHLIVCDVVTNTVDTVNADAGTCSFGPGDQFLISRPGLPYQGVARATRLRFALIDPAVLCDVAGTDGHEGHIEFLDVRPVSRRAQSDLQQTIAYVRDEVMASVTVSPSPLLESAATRLLAAAVLHAYPNTATGPLTPTDRRDARPSTVERAVAYIEAGPDRDITVTDLARAAYVTPRALQYAFRRHLGMTPMAYVRTVRLDHAHRDLQRADPAARGSVSDIATRWGFSVSAFARAYRTAYGRNPGDTVRSR